jgi:hypothetical protein
MSPAGLTRGSIFLWIKMDCRAKPGNDEFGRGRLVIGTLAERGRNAWLASIAIRFEAEPAPVEAAGVVFFGDAAAAGVVARALDIRVNLGFLRGLWGLHLPPRERQDCNCACCHNE